MNQQIAEQSDDELRARLNTEMGTLSWAELQRSFARGVVVKVQGPLGLLETAIAFLQDDKMRVETWMSENSIVKASTEDAQHWQDNATVFRALVVAPWVLVQEIDQ